MSVKFVSELCGNHQGRLDTLSELVARSADAGATFCKIQSFFADDLSFEWRHDYDRIKSLELDWEKHAKFVEMCKQYGVTPMTSVYTTQYGTRLHEIGIKHIKIGSAQADAADLIKYYVALGFKVYVSTGGHDLGSFPAIGPLAGIFHCVSKYPHTPWEADVGRMLQLRRWWRTEPLGLSDHCDPLHIDWDLPAKAAIYMGAELIEKHVTVLDRSRTKDGPVSITPDQLSELVLFSKRPKEEQLRDNPYFGLFYSPKTEDEKALIRKYKGRWKVA